MARVRIVADVDPELRRRVKVAAASGDRSVSEWIEEAVRRELEREEAEMGVISRMSAPAFVRDWISEEDSGYDEFA